MKSLILLTTCLTALVMAVHSESADPEDSYSFSPTLALSVKPKNTLHLKNVFKDAGYSWGNLNEGVPPIIIRSLPKDLHLLPTVTERKQIFFLTLLPMVLLANEQIEQQRRELESIILKHDSGKTLSNEQRARLSFFASEYDLKGDPLNDKNIRRRLLERIDIIPPSLALAQAANESAWGTSRFSQQANNLFGEWTFEQGAGLVPRNRPAGSRHEIKRFDNLYKAITSYTRNLNTHRAYRDFRKERFRIRSSGHPLRGIDLAQGLIRYSERREAYVREIKRIIRQNNLSALVSVRLRKNDNEQEKLVDSSVNPPSSNPYSRDSSLRIDP